MTMFRNIKKRLITTTSLLDLEHSIFRSVEENADTNQFTINHLTPSFRNRVFPYYLLIEHLPANIILFSIPFVIKCTAKILKTCRQVNDLTENNLD